MRFRPSELFALRRKGFDLAASTISLSETAYRGKIRLWGKRRKSLGVKMNASGRGDDMSMVDFTCAEHTDGKGSLPMRK